MMEKTTFREHIVQGLGVCPQGIGDLSDMYSESLDWANPGCQVAGPFGPINKED